MTTQKALIGARSLALVSSPHRAKAVFLLDNVVPVLGGYLRGQLILALIIGVLALLFFLVIQHVENKVLAPRIGGHAELHCPSKRPVGEA